MDIKSFIKSEIILPRIRSKEVLVIYDPDLQYRDLCLEMKGDKFQVVDASESSILSREIAMKALLELGNRTIEKLLIYIPKNKPLGDEEKQRDPFSIYGEIGAVFPDGDGDSYFSICLRAKPDFSTQVRTIFQTEKKPPFAMIDAIGGGLQWPILRSNLKVESTRDILFSFLCPNPSQKTKLQESDSWVTEIKELFKITIDLNLKTKGQTWSLIADELWRFLLFSEFIFDFPKDLELPNSLRNVPCATENALPLIYDICDRLRSDTRTQDIYIERAESIEKDLQLESICKEFHNLGERDTFPFEERTFLRVAIESILKDNLDDTRKIISQHAKSVWTGKGENQVQWDYLKSGLSLIEACDDKERAFSDHKPSMNDLIEFYVTQYRDVDQKHREFEQSTNDFIWRDSEGILIPILHYVRKKYSKLTDKLQLQFTHHLQTSGWPISDRLANVDLFDKIVSSKLAVSGNRVAYLMVDALRYELGVVLEKQLSEDDTTSITPSLVQLPSITTIGMASLLPGASVDFKIKNIDSELTPYIQEKMVKTVKQRMDLIHKKYGNRFQETRLEDFVRTDFKIKDDTDLLVLRSVEIDSHFENNPETAPSEITNILRRIRIAIRKIKQAGFAEAIIVTDHGFFMNPDLGPGSTCTKLQGDWETIHYRSLLGNGQADSNHFALNAEKVGIKGDYSKFAGPLSLAPYRGDMLYFHGGFSLQECIAPVIQISFKKQAEIKETILKILLKYKNGQTKISTRLPMIELEAYIEGLFIQEFEILLEAHDSKGRVVGEASRGGIVDGTTGCIMVKQGIKEKIPLKMSLEFEGMFSIKAINPNTMMVYAELKLETDYMV